MKDTLRPNSIYCMSGSLFASPLMRKGNFWNPNSCEGELLPSDWSMGSLIADPCWQLVRVSSREILTPPPEGAATSVPKRVRKHLLLCTRNVILHSLATCVWLYTKGHSHWLHSHGLYCPAHSQVLVFTCAQRNLDIHIPVYTINIGTPVSDHDIFFCAGACNGYL